MIVLKSVSKIYGHGRRRKNALVNISAVLEAKGHYVILGMPKSGKTTLLNIMSGLVNPTRGKVLRYGKVGFPVGYGGIGLPRYSGRELALLLANLYEADAKEIVEFVTEFSELGPDMRRPISDLDPIPKNRLYVTVGYALPLDFYLFDGSVGRTDEQFRAKCQAAFEARREEAGTIFVTNDYRNARLYGSKGGVLHEGRLEFFDTLDEALDRFQTIRRAADHGTLGYARDLMRAGETAEARAYIRQYLTEQSDPAGYELLLGLAMRASDYSGVKEVCHAALQDYPNNTNFHVALATVAEREGDHAEMATHAQAALTIAPANYHAGTMLAKAYEGLGQDREAAATWNDLADRHKDLRTWLPAIRADTKIGNWEQALSRMDGAVAAFGPAAETALTDLRIRALVATGRSSDAEKALLAVAERDLEGALRVVNQLAAEAAPPAIVHFVRQLHLKFDLTKNMTRNLQFMLNLIERQLAANGPDGAAVSELFGQIRKPTSQVTDAAAPHVARASMAEREGNHAEMATHAQAALTINPANYHALTMLAKAYERLGQDREAAATWNDLADRHKDLRTWLPAIRADTKIGNWEQALSRIDGAVAAFGPAAETVLTDLRIRALVATGRSSDAEKALLAVAERDLEKALRVVTQLGAEASPLAVVVLLRQLHLKFDLTKSMTRNLQFMLNIIERQLATSNPDGGSAAVSELFVQIKNATRQPS